jgi:hypothetical protein
LVVNKIKSSIPKLWSAALFFVIIYFFTSFCRRRLKPAAIYRQPYGLFARNNTILCLIRWKPILRQKTIKKTLFYVLTA